MPRRFRVPFDGFLLALIATVAIAAILPARGVAAPVVAHVVYAAIALLFFVYGIKLSPAAVAGGLANWRLQLLVFSSTFVLFPLLGLVLTTLARPFLPSALLLGILFVCVLPSTVQSSIAFTSIARGNVSAALCSASVSNLLGMVVTPLLVSIVIRVHGAGLSLGALRDVALQLLLPFVAGQVARPFLHAWLARHPVLTTCVDRGSILIVVYSAFSEGMVAGIWSQITIRDLVVLLAFDALLLAVVLALTTLFSRRLGFGKEDEIAIVFCGSKKSMAGGIPMANILFPGQDGIGLILLPLMLFHQLQLFACAALARRYARRPAAPTPEPALAARAIVLGS